MRLALAQALLMEPDLLLLDEPTNMLDMRAVLWLEYKLQSWPNTLLTVSHDRSYLNAVCTDIINLSAKQLIYYKVSTDRFELSCCGFPRYLIFQIELLNCIMEHIEFICKSI